MPKQLNNRSRRTLCLNWSEEFFLALTTKGVEITPEIQSIEKNEVENIGLRVFGEKLPNTVLSAVFHALSFSIHPINGNTIFLVAAELDDILEAYDMVHSNVEPPISNAPPK